MRRVKTSLAADPRYRTNAQRVEQRDELVPLVSEIMRRHPNATWHQLLTEATVPHAELWDYARIFADEQVAVRGMKVTVRDPAGKPVDLLGSPFHLTGATLAVPTTPPQLGQDTDATLMELLKLDPARLSELRRAGVI